MVEVIRAFCWHQNFVPKGFSALALGLYTCIKSLKMCLKSDLEEIILKLATFGQRENFVPNGLSAPARGYVHMVKREKNVYKIGLQSIFLNLQQMGKVISAVCWHQNCVPKGLSILAPGLYTYIESLKMCIQLDFFFLNLQQTGKVITAFCWHLSPRGCLSLPWGYIRV